MDLDPERIIKSPFLIGALGALVALKGAPGETWPTRALNIVSGALIAGYGAPGICEYFSMTTPGLQGAMAFAAGLFGMNLVSAGVAWIKEMKLADVLPWARRKE